MTKVTFNNEEMAKDYINGLFNCGMKTVKHIDLVSEGTFFVSGNDVYFAI